MSEPEVEQNELEAKSDEELFQGRLDEVNATIEAELEKLRIERAIAREKAIRARYCELAVFSDETEELEGELSALLRATAMRSYYDPQSRRHRLEYQRDDGTWAQA